MKPIMLSVGHREPVSLLFHRAKPRNVTLLLLLFLLPRWDTDSMNQHGIVKLHFSFNWIVRTLCVLFTVKFFHSFSNQNRARGMIDGAFQFSVTFLGISPVKWTSLLRKSPRPIFHFTDQTVHTVATFYALSHTVISRSSCSLLTRSPNKVWYWCLISKVYVMCPFVPLLHQENLFNKLILLSYSLHGTKEITNVTASFCAINKRNAWGVYFQLSNAHAIMSIIYVVRSY